ncbi:MAG: PilZ domain-containing protein [Candidatus Omnitrophota bacterium]
MPKNNQERRRYLRLDTVLPVEFKIGRRRVSGGEETLVSWQQGFTQDLAYAGMGLRANFLTREIARIPVGELRLSLIVHPPFRKDCIRAKGRVAWIEEIAGQPQGLNLGLEWTDIVPCDRQALLRYARYRRNLPRLGWAIIVVLAAGLLFAQGRNFRLRITNQRLIDNLRQSSRELSRAKDYARKIDERKQALDERLFSAQSEIRRLKNSISQIEADNKRREVAARKYPSQEKEASGKQGISSEQEAQIKELNARLAELFSQREVLERKLREMSSAQAVINSKIARSEKKRLALEKETFDKMYAWVKARQDYQSGLIASFLGDKDIADWAFTYDQALAAIAFVYFKDYDRAKRIFDFYIRHSRPGQGFANAYYASGGDVSEYVVHSGPNIWLGIAVLHYARRSGDKGYLSLARSIARWLIRLQGEDELGGIRGGPRVSWFATEHNLDAYAFFGMLYGLTGEKRYLAARDKVFGWLKTQAYHKDSVPIWRGKGDSTIATDTYFWSIAAVGPQRLAQADMDPDKIVKFAEDNCYVRTKFSRAEDGASFDVSGFDFAPQRHLPRGGIVSAEFTAQVVVSYRIMADYHRRKGDVGAAEEYDSKAEALLNELSKMLVLSVSRAGQTFPCLPYASQENADTGHGWWTPKGKKTASLSATVYTIFAYYGFNPLFLGEHEGRGTRDEG